MDRRFSESDEDNIELEIKETDILEDKKYYDIIEMEDVPSKKCLDDNDNILIITKITDNYFVDCISREILKNQLENKTNIRYECKKLEEDEKIKDRDWSFSLDKDRFNVFKDSFIKLELSGGKVFYVTYRDYYKIIYSIDKIFYIERTGVKLELLISGFVLDENKKYRDRKPAAEGFLVGADHCQSGSSQYLYKLKVCSGKNCLDKIFENKEYKQYNEDWGDIKYEVFSRDFVDDIVALLKKGKIDKAKDYTEEKLFNFSEFVRIDNVVADLINVKYEDKMKLSEYFLEKYKFYNLISLSDEDLGDDFEIVKEQIKNEVIPNEEIDFILETRQRFVEIDIDKIQELGKILRNRSEESIEDWIELGKNIFMGNDEEIANLIEDKEDIEDKYSEEFEEKGLETLEAEIFKEHLNIDEEFTKDFDNYVFTKQELKDNKKKSVGEVQELRKIKLKNKQNKYVTMFREKYRNDVDNFPHKIVFEEDIKTTKKNYEDTILRNMLKKRQDSFDEELLTLDIVVEKFPDLNIDRKELDKEIDKNIIKDKKRRIKRRLEWNVRNIKIMRNIIKEKKKEYILKQMIKDVINYSINNTMIDVNSDYQFREDKNVRLSSYILMSNNIHNIVQNVITVVQHPKIILKDEDKLYFESNPSLIKLNRLHPDKFIELSALISKKLEEKNDSKEKEYKIKPKKIYFEEEEEDDEDFTNDEKEWVEYIQKLTTYKLFPNELDNDILDTFNSKININKEFFEIAGEKVNAFKYLLHKMLEEPNIEKKEKIAGYIKILVKYLVDKEIIIEDDEERFEKSDFLSYLENLPSEYIYNNLYTEINEILFPSPQ